jgi:hypothetical protein
VRVAAAFSETRRNAQKSTPIEFAALLQRMTY